MTGALIKKIITFTDMDIVRHAEKANYNRYSVLELEETKTKINR